VRPASISVDQLSLLLAWGEAVIRHTRTLTEDDHRQLRGAVDAGWTAVHNATEGERNEGRE
jgi:hypothetical protein